MKKPNDAKAFRARRAKLLRDIRAEYFTSVGRLALDTVTAQTLALHFGIKPKRVRARFAAKLDENVRKQYYRMSVGIAGAPYLLFTLADNGYFETARRVLLNSGYPGWLYGVDMGATTVWERWNSLMPDGSPNLNGMNSYNYDAYGSVMEFVWRRIAGVEALAPGFAKILLVPHPMKGLPELHAEFDSVHGKIVCSYRQKDGKIVYHMQIPDGVAARIVLPCEEASVVRGGIYDFERLCEDLHEGPFTSEHTV